MTVQERVHMDQAVQFTLAVLQEILGEYSPRDFAVRLWDDTTWEPDPGQPARFTLVLEHPETLWQMFSRPSELSLAEAYIYGDCDVEGQLEALVEVAHCLLSRPRSFWETLRQGRQLLRLPASHRARQGRQGARLDGEKHSVERDRQAVTYHYDVSEKFYALFLDRRMVYSCAYFVSPEEDLDTAQERKLDYICRKLRLRPGEKMLDIGCGWGGLILHAAQRYGAEATGITLSRPQAEWAARRIREAGLEGRCRVEVRDYREWDAPGGYDKLVSIGMVEHVGADRLGEYFGAAHRLLRPGGVFLNHGIGDNYPRTSREGENFVHTYVFPDGDLPPVNEVLRAAEGALFEVRDVESLREHYALTLRHWVRRLEARHLEALRHVDEATYRVWRLYMAGAAARFARGYLNVYQALLVKPDQGRSGLPLTRGDWY